jgi:integrase
MSSLTGIALNRAWRSTGSWSCGIALISNPVNSPRAQSTYVLAPCVAWHTKLPTAVFSAPIWQPVFVASKGVKKLGIRLGNWLTAEQGNALWQAPDRQRLKGKRDRALLALLLACGLRRHEAVALTLDHLQQREEHWAIVDLVGKGGHVRTVPVPDWVRTELNDWLAATIPPG